MVTAVEARYDFPDAYEAVVRVLAFNIQATWNAVLASTGSAKNRELFERITNPQIGDIVLEVTSLRRWNTPDWPGPALGILVAVEQEPSYTKAQWRAKLKHDRECVAEHRNPWGFGSFESFSAWVAKQDPDVVPTYPVYVLETLVGEHEVMRWENAKFIAGLVDWPR